MQVLIGTNVFEDCETILSFRTKTFLAVSNEPLRVQLHTPDDLPSGRHVHVDSQAESPSSGAVKVVAKPDFVGIFWEMQPLILAARVEPTVINVHLDLRALGLAIFVDPDGLHVGGGTFSRNAIKNAKTAIALG